MKRAFEAIWEQGKVIPAESIRINDHTRLLVVILDEQHDSDGNGANDANDGQDSRESSSTGWRSLRGKYNGKLSSVEQFMQYKQEEKLLER